MPEPQEKLTIEIPVEHPDEDAMLRALLSVGTYQPAIESEGEESVAERIRAADAAVPNHGRRLSVRQLLPDADLPQMSPRK